MRKAVTLIVWTLCACAALAAQTPAGGRNRDAEKMGRSVAAIMTRSVTPPGKGTASRLRTTFSDTELNAWLVADGKENVPVGIVSPRVTFTGPGKIAFKGVLDLDAVRKSRERGWLDPFAYLNGFMEFAMVGSLSGVGGQGTFDVDSATLGNVSVPKVLLQELISYYSKSPEFPGGITLGKPFALPASVRDIIIARGSATVVQ